MTSSRLNTKLIGALLCAGSIIVPVAAFADISTEIKAAESHAGFSAAATNLQDAQMHMHHALNCLVGPGGDGFDKTALNPCNNQGNGLIPDATDATQKAVFEKLAAEARAGLASSDLATVKKDAADIEAKLKAIKTPA